MTTTHDPCYIQTASGHMVDVMNMTVDDISIQDIASSLSKLCRFNGHSNLFYSVAEHSVWVSRMVMKEEALWGLLHDAAEAYIGDITTPLKRWMESQGFRIDDIQDHILEVVADKFGLPHGIPSSVLIADQTVLATEKERLMVPGRDWGLPPAWPGIDLECFYPPQAYTLFLKEFRQITGEKE